MITIFILGFITGLLICIFIDIGLIYFKYPIQQKINIIEKQISNIGPRPKGFIIEPVDENEEIREKIIEKNRKQGRDTPISELE